MRSLLLCICLFVIPVDILSQSWINFGGHLDTQIRSTYKDSTTGYIYVGGIFDSIYSIAAKNVAYFDGSNWHAMDAGFNGRVNSIIKYNNQIYAGGLFDSSGTTFLKNSVAKWNGVQWLEIDADADLYDEFLGGPTDIPHIQDMCIHNNKLFICGIIRSQANIHNPNPFGGIVSYDGSHIRAIFNPNGTTFGFAPLISLASFQGELYVTSGGGVKDTCPLGFSPAVWAYGLLKYDSLCKTLHSVGNWPICYAFDIVSLDTALVFGTDLVSPTFGNFVSCYNGSSFVLLADGLNYVARQALVYDGKLTVTGGFTSNFSGTQALHNIAQWDGVSWQPFNLNCNLNYNGSFLSNFDTLLLNAGYFDSCGVDPVYKTVSYRSPGPTSVDEIKDDLKFNLSPNPVDANRGFQITYDLAQNKDGIFKLYDITGREVFNYALPAFSVVQNFQLPFLSPGLYLASIRSGNSQSTLKLLVEE